jgi:hypothetical protein
LLKDELEAQGVKSKSRTSASGGKPFARGALYLMLQNRIYRGEIVHKEQSYPGEHPPIIDPPLWDAVQAQLARNAAQHNSGTRTRQPSLLAGMLFDGDGNRMTPSHAVKRGTRYRYYGPIQGGPVNDALDITRNGGGSFNFASVDLAANNGNVNFTLTGFLGGIQQYVFNGVEPGRPPGPFGFDTIINPDAAVAIDDARVALNILGTSGNVDNIVVNAVAAPEPASILLVGSALIGIGVWRRRKIAPSLLAAAFVADQTHSLAM